MTKKEIAEKLGKIFFLEDQFNLAAKLDYQVGIPLFDEYLNGRKLKDINAVIHLTKYPKGFLIKIQKTFSSYPFALKFSEITATNIYNANSVHALIFDTSTNQRITFSIEEDNIAEVRQFFDDIRYPYYYNGFLNGGEQKQERQRTNEKSNWNKKKQASGSYTEEEKKFRGEENNYEEKSETNGMTRAKALAILGLRVTASNEEITRSYRELAKKFNTDQRDHYEAHVKLLLEEKMKEINSAKEYLLKR